MNIGIKIHNYDNNNVFIHEPTANTVLHKTDLKNNNKYYKIYYSDNNIILNGIYLFLNIYVNTCDCIFKNNFYFSSFTNQNVINYLIDIEKKILNKYDITNKSPTFLLENILNSNMIKIYKGNNSYSQKKNKEVIIKISGIWEDNEKYGLVFKFIEI